MEKENYIGINEISYKLDNDYPQETDKLRWEKLLQQEDPVDFIDASDHLNLYLKEATKQPLLTAEQEQQLFQKIKVGDTEAIDIMFKSNTRLVISEAKKYLDRGVPFLDLIQEGNMGILKAIDMFEPERGLKFSTYATYWVRQKISRAVHEKSRTIRIPVNLYDKIVKLNNQIADLDQKLHHEPSIKEIAEATNSTEEYVQSLIAISKKPLSLDMSFKEEEGLTFGELIPDPNTDVAEESEKNIVREQVEKLMETLTDSYERKIVELRYGLHDGHSYSLKETGEIIGGLSEEDVARIESKALRSLRPEANRLGLRADYDPYFERRAARMTQENFEYFNTSDKHLLTQNLVRNILSEFKLPRHRTILELRFGLFDGNIHTLEEVGSIVGVTREMVRQVEVRAFRKMGLKPDKHIESKPVQNVWKEI